MNIIHNKFPSSLPDNTYVAIDTELYGMTESRMHRPITGKFACMTLCADPETVYLIDQESMVHEALSKIWNCVWIMHHAKFDITHLRRWADIPPRTKLVDTMIMDRIIWNGYYDSFSLQALARRYLLEYIEKEQQAMFEVADSMTPEMLEYSAKDASITLRVWRKQLEILTKTHMKLWRWIELPTLWAVLDFRGFRVDIDAWKSLAISNRAKQEEIDAILPFNPRSPKQVVKGLRDTGFKNLETSGEDDLLQAMRKFPNTEAAKLAQLVLDSRMYSKRASTYGETWLDNYLEFFPDGTWGFIANYWIIGAETSRMSASEPAIQTLPTRDTKDYRKCFIAHQNCKLVIADFSQQEVFVAAYISQDPKLKELCNSGSDIYIQMAKLMYNKDIEKKDPLRQRMKSVVLGTDYGMSKYGLARREGISLNEAEEVIHKFKSIFSTFAAWMTEQQHPSPYVVTPTGRKIWLNPYSGQSERNALNAPIQGFSAEITKRSLIALHQNWKFDCEFGVVGVFHDEFVLDVPTHLADDVSVFVKDTMIETANYMCPGMNFRAESVVADSWAEK